VTKSRDQNPTRAAILDAMATESVPVSARRLATLLDEDRASVHYHLTVLRGEGRVEVAHVNYLSSHVEHYYRLTVKEQEGS
jgi:DNA-binding transcriptional ArsR family regulator